MKFKSVFIISNFIENKIPERYLSKFEEFLLSGSIFTNPSEFLAWVDTQEWGAIAFSNLINI